MGFKLSQQVTQQVDARLIEHLKRLKDERRLRFPLLRGRLQLGRREVDLLGAGLAALFGELVGLASRVVELPGHGGQVVCDVGHVLGVLALREGPQRLLDIIAEAIGEQLVGLCVAFDGLDDSGPRNLEDTAQTCLLAMAFADRPREQRH